MSLPQRNFYCHCFLFLIGKLRERILLRMRRFIFLILFVAAVLSLPKGTKYLTRGFKLNKLHFEYPYQPQWETDIPMELDSILNQPYAFLGYGAQSYVFESQDREYVVKFFRFDRLPEHRSVDLLLSNYKRAYDILKEQTGLIYIHLNQTSMNLPTLHCKDAIGRNVHLPLDAYRFVVQKKALLFTEALKQASNNPLLMQKRLDAFLQLIQSRAAKEVMNTDTNIYRNFAFLDDQALEIDFGNYVYSPGMDQKKETTLFFRKLHRWLEKNDPKWVSYLDQKKGLFE